MFLFCYLLLFYEFILTRIKLANAQNQSSQFTGQWITPSFAISCLFHVLIENSHSRITFYTIQYTCHTNAIPVARISRVADIVYKMQQFLLSHQLNA